jgi:hypothetical protein
MLIRAITRISHDLGIDDVAFGNGSRTTGRANLTWTLHGSEMTLRPNNLKSLAGKASKREDTYIR